MMQVLLLYLLSLKYSKGNACHNLNWFYIQIEGNIKTLTYAGKNFIVYLLNIDYLINGFVWWYLEAKHERYLITFFVIPNL